jgi:hypothetical protein
VVQYDSEHSVILSKSPGFLVSVFGFGFLPFLSLRVPASPAFDNSDPAGSFSNVANLVLLDETAR